jgi:hypothetical protein
MQTNGWKNIQEIGIVHGELQRREISAKIAMKKDDHRDDNRFSLKNPCI